MTDLTRLPARSADGALHVVVESPRGSRVKLAWDTELGALSLRRPLPAGLAYPYDWGFVAGTRAADGDPLDAMILWDHTTPAGAVVPCRPIAVVELEQQEHRQRTRNDRLIVVPVRDPASEALRDLADVPERLREEIAQFFLSAVYFEPKDARILGWADAAAAAERVDRHRR